MIGAEVALLFQEGDPGRPLIVGRIVEPVPQVSDPAGDTRRRTCHNRRRAHRASLRQGVDRHGERRPHHYPRHLFDQPRQRREPHSGRIGQPELMRKTILREIVRQHAEMAAFLWTVYDYHCCFPKRIRTWTRSGCRACSNGWRRIWTGCGSPARRARDRGRALCRIPRGGGTVRPADATAGRGADTGIGPDLDKVRGYLARKL